MKTNNSRRQAHRLQIVTSSLITGYVLLNVSGVSAVLFGLAFVFLYGYTWGDEWLPELIVMKCLYWSVSMFCLSAGVSMYSRFGTPFFIVCVLLGVAAIIRGHYLSWVYWLRERNR